MAAGNQFPLVIASPPISDPAIVSPTSIGCQCTDAFAIQDTLHNPAYLRQDAFGQFMRPDRVGATIQACLGKLYNSDNVQRLVEYSIRNPRVFLTLSSMKLVKKIPLLYLGNFADNNLPIRLQWDDKRLPFQVYSVGDHQNLPWQCFVQGEDEFRSWEYSEIAHFLRNQWLFLAVIFRHDGLNYTIHQDRPLPYINLPQRTANEGSFGKVFKLGLQADHMRFISRRYLPVVR